MWFKEKCSSLFCTNSNLKSLFWWQITTGTINLCACFTGWKIVAFVLFMSENTVHMTPSAVQKTLQARWAKTRKSCVHSMCSCREDFGFSLHFLYTTGHAHNDLCKPIRMNNRHTYTNLENLLPPMIAHTFCLFILLHWQAKLHWW